MDDKNMNNDIVNGILDILKEHKCIDDTFVVKDDYSNLFGEILFFMTNFEQYREYVVDELYSMIDKLKNEIGKIKE